MVDISCVNTRFSGNIPLPASKSISNRLLIMQELSGGTLQLKNLSAAEDTRLLQECLKNYPNSGLLFADNAGTVMRFMTALLAVSEGKWELKGSPRLHQRPIGPLVETLQLLGSCIRYSGKSGYPPIFIEGQTLNGGSVSIDAGTSSQFISAILMVAPRFKQPLCLELTGNIVSSPYIDMTIALMKDCGIPIEKNGNIINVRPSEYQPARFIIESDWSSAAFFYALAVLSESADFFLPGLTAESLQGDAIVQQWFEPLGVHTSFQAEGVRICKTRMQATQLELDFSGHPDLMLPMAVACAGSGVKFSARGLQNLVIKESNRLKGTAENLTALGFEVHYTNSTLTLEPGQPWNNASLHPTLPVLGDHRMAMSFALLAVCFPAITLDETEVVSKSFPGYIEVLKTLGFQTC